MRALERTPVLSQDVVVISDTQKERIRRLAEKLAPTKAAIEERWRRRISAIFGSRLDLALLRALGSINPVNWPQLLAERKINAFLEQVEYHGRRLAKLDVPPHQVLESLRKYEEALLPDLRRLFPSDYQQYISALDHLYFCIKLTLNNAYYQVRDLEAQAFFEMLQDQLESLSVDDLLQRVLDTLMGTFRAPGGIILLREEKSRRLRAKAWKGMDEKLARCFDTTVGYGVSGQIAKSGKPLVIVDLKNHPLATKPPLRRAFHSLWGVPLTVDGKVTGVLHLGFAQEYRCLPRELKLLDAVAERCALAIDKARLLEELHQREEQVRALGEHMLRVEEEERRRMSRELHDEVGQSMLVIRLYLEMLQNDLPPEARHLLGKLDETRRLTEQAIGEMRRLISALSPNVLEELGLPASIRQFVNNFSRTFPGKVKVRMSRVEDLPKSTEITIYRLVQECFANVIKHSQAKHVSLQLTRRNGQVRLKVADDGVGFSVKRASAKRNSFGLSGMRERVALLGGEIDIQSSKGKGTKVEIALPS